MGRWSFFNPYIDLLLFVFTSNIQKCSFDIFRNVDLTQPIMIILINHDQYQLVLTGQMFFKCIDLNISESTSKSSSVFFFTESWKVSCFGCCSFYSYCCQTGVFYLSDVFARQEMKKPSEWWIILANKEWLRSCWHMLNTSIFDMLGRRSVTASTVTNVREWGWIQKDREKIKGLVYPDGKMNGWTFLIWTFLSFFFPFILNWLVFASESPSGSLSLLTLAYVTKKIKN